MGQMADDDINTNHIYLKNKKKNYTLNHNIHCFQSQVKNKYI